ncbi:MAG: CocE/NonD family hydrolase [Pseudomonadota bacterium]
MPTLSELLQLRQSIGPILKKAIVSGQLFNPSCQLTEPDPDILCEYDVEIPLSDGSYVTANVFRSKEAATANQKLPVVMCAHPYDNHLIPALGKTPLGGPPHQYRLIPQEGKPVFSKLTSWEAPDPNFWVPAGYAVVNMNLPGYANSGGRPTLSSVAQNQAFSEAIDWIGAQDWCTGSVGLNGVSYLAISQYGVAAGNSEYGVPKCLKAICPWEGLANMYQDMFFEGGIEEKGFPIFWWTTEVKPTINCSVEEFYESEGELPHTLSESHPFYDEYWQSKIPDYSAIKLPMLICGSFSDQGLHTRGCFQIFRQASSEHKWVYTHRSLKWDAYYSQEVMQLTKSFFDCFVKGEADNGFLEKPPVRLEVRSSRAVIRDIREEQEWPLARTQYKKLFISAGGKNLSESSPTAATDLVYDAKSGELRLTYKFTEDTELTGNMKLRLWVEARAKKINQPLPEDIALFVGIEKLSTRGQRIRFYGSVGNYADLVTRGLIKVSRRALDEKRSTEWEPVLLNQRDEKLKPGEVVPLEIALNPSSTFFTQGESLQLVISPNEIVSSPPYVKDNRCNHGLHVVHTGGVYDSYLLIPVIPS